ncbi:hypothetical protein F53441_1231 [Fusarium austroafricanum]|uniref:Uncharacterized protein n=1 Tax=Fusarium austroafricanum TaxID=2364996 RepID=A0A8H4P2G3_9HYPO|nr:hypothetical protein F53441_1231 [Fusarium austroafricanum]
MEDSENKSFSAPYITDEEAPVPRHSRKPAPDQDEGRTKKSKPVVDPTASRQTPGGQASTHPLSPSSDSARLRQRFAESRNRPRGTVAPPKQTRFGVSFNNRLREPPDNTSDDFSTYNPYANSSAYGPEISPDMPRYGPPPSNHNYSRHQSQPPPVTVGPPPLATQSHYQPPVQNRETTRNMVNHTLEAQPQPSLNREEVERIAKGYVESERADWKRHEEQAKKDLRHQLEADRARIEQEIKSWYHSELESETRKITSEVARDRDTRVETEKHLISAKWEKRLAAEVEARRQAEHQLQSQLKEGAERERHLRVKLSDSESKLKSQQLAQDDMQRKMTTESKEALQELETKVISETNHREHVEGERNSLIDKLAISERLYLSEVDKNALAQNECSKLQAQLSLSEMKSTTKDEHIAKVTDNRDDLNNKLGKCKKKLKSKEEAYDVAEKSRRLLETKMVELEHRLASEVEEKAKLINEHTELQNQFSVLQEDYSIKVSERETEVAEIGHLLETERCRVTSAEKARFEKEIADLRTRLEVIMEQESASRIAPIQQGLVLLAGQLASETSLKKRAEHERDELRVELFDMRRAFHRQDSSYDESGSNDYEERRQNRILDATNTASRPRQRGRERSRARHPPTRPPAPDPPQLYVDENRTGEVSSGGRINGSTYWVTSDTGTIQNHEMRDDAGRVINWKLIDGYDEALAPDGLLYQGTDGYGQVYMTYPGRQQTPLDSEKHDYSASEDSEPEREDTTNESSMESTTTASYHSSKHQTSASSGDSGRGQSGEYVPVPIPGGKKTQDAPRVTKQDRPQHGHDLHQPTPLRPQVGAKIQSDINHDMEPDFKNGANTEAPQASDSRPQASQPSTNSEVSTPSKRVPESEVLNHDNGRGSIGLNSYPIHGREPVLLLPYADNLQRPVYLVPNPDGRTVRVLNGRTVEEDQYGLPWSFQRINTNARSSTESKGNTRRTGVMNKTS